MRRFDRLARSVSGGPFQAFGLGLIVWFLALVDLVRAVRADLLTAGEPSWAIPRLVLSLAVVAVASAAGALAAAGFFLWSRRDDSVASVEPLPLKRSALLFVALLALAFGVFVRFAWLDRAPASVWFDELLPLDPSLALSGRWSDFRDAIRLMPGGHSAPNTVGVLYLEGYRLLMRVLGVSLFSIRSASALASVLALLTAFALARRFFPRGGATIVVLVVAGLRWPLILSRYAWNSLALVPLVDLGTLLVLRARRRAGLGAAAAAGAVAGLGAHIYLAAWIAGLALGCVLLWPTVRPVPLVRRAGLALFFGLGFLGAAAPLFLLHRDRTSSYFGRASHQSLWIDYRRTHYWTLPFTIVADGIQAPWLVPDPERRHDLPKSRLGWIVGIPVAVALIRAWRSPRDDLSALLFCHAGAAMLASLRWGFPGHPNGLRFAYLTTVAALAAGSGTLYLVGLAAPPGGGAWRSSRSVRSLWGPYSGRRTFSCGPNLGKRSSPIGAIRPWSAARSCAGGSKGVSWWTRICHWSISFSTRSCVTGSIRKTRGRAASTPRGRAPGARSVFGSGPSPLRCARENGGSRSCGMPGASITAPSSGAVVLPDLPARRLFSQESIAPALRPSPWDHAAGQAREGARSVQPAACKIAASASETLGLFRPLRTNAISKVPAGKASGPLTAWHLSHRKPRRPVRLAEEATRR